MSKIKNVKIFKVILVVLITILLISIVMHLMPVMKDISTPEGKIAFKQRIENTGMWGVLTLFSLQIAQIFLVILPGEPLEILAGMCYGTIGGAIFIFTTVFLTTTVLFYLVKKYGKKFIYNFFSKERIDKIENSKFFKKPKTVEIIFAILFLIPGTPKDFLVYIGGLFPIKPIRFILISTFARFPSVISSTIVGNNLLGGNWEISIITYIVTFIATLIMILFINKFDKNKIASDALDSIK